MTKMNNATSVVCYFHNRLTGSYNYVYLIKYDCIVINLNLDNMICCSLNKHSA